MVYPALCDLRCKDIAVHGNHAKFSQIRNLHGRQLAAGDRLLAEASPFNTLWDIGLSARDPAALYPPPWPEFNRVGNVLL